MSSSFGDRIFAAAGPQVWNSLPPNLRLCGLSYGQFRRLLKTFLFGQWGHGAVWTAFNCASLTYLQNTRFQDSEKTIKLSMLIVMPRVVVCLCTDSLSIEVKERNPRCAAGSNRQAKIISQSGKNSTSHVRQHDVTLIGRRVLCNNSTTAQS